MRDKVEFVNTKKAEYLKNCFTNSINFYSDLLILYSKGYFKDKVQKY